MPIETFGAPTAPAPPPEVEAAHCPACGCRSAALFFDAGRRPPALVHCHSAEEARALPRATLRYLRCLDCGHVFNPGFRLAPSSNRGYEGAGEWSAFLEQVRMEMRSRLGPTPTVVAIGRHASTFLEGLADGRPHGRFFTAQPEQAAAAVAALKPDLIISRHVGEHLCDPLLFLESLSLAHPGAMLYFEAPCIDRSIEIHRAEDFLHEHPSLFTTASFSRMIARATAAGLVSVDALDHGYAGEVMFAFLHLLARKEFLERARAAQGFAAMVSASRHVIMLELANLYLAGTRVAIWGASGRGAVFFQTYHVDAQRFPLVVDSDPSRQGVHVPGTGQKIQSPLALAGKPVEVLILPCPWRAMEITAEMVRLGIRCHRLLIPYGGRLVDYLDQSHCYHRPAQEPRASGAQFETHPGPALLAR